MTTHNHWTSAGAGHGDAESSQALSRAKEQQRAIASANKLAHARMNRLLVGGRAHTRKHGLS